MADWTGDPKIQQLMAHLGKTGKTGKPTRSAFVAGQVKRLLTQAEARIADRNKAAKADTDLTKELEDTQAFIKERNLREAEVRKSVYEAGRQRELAGEKGVDMGVEIATALAEFEEDQRRAHAQVEELKKSVTMKRTTVRRFDDRIEHYRKQIFTMIEHLSSGGKSAA